MRLLTTTFLALYCIFAPVLLLAQNATLIHEQIRESLIFIEGIGQTEEGLPIEVFGTGTVVTSDGVVITSLHILKPLENSIPEKIQITGRAELKTGQLYSAQIIDSLEGRDLAKLKLAGAGADHFKVACFDRLTRIARAAGRSILTSGFPRQLPYLADSASVVSTDGPRGTIIVSFTSDDGQSGSPVYDQNGAVIGILKGSYVPQPSNSVVIPARDFVNFLPPEPDECKNFARTTQTSKARIAKRDQAFLLGYDSAIALAKHVQGSPSIQIESTVNKRLNLLELGEIRFPDEPLGGDQLGGPANAYAEEVSGALAPFGESIVSAFQLGWLGVITTNSPSISVDGFSVHRFAERAGFNVNLTNLSAEGLLENLASSANTRIGQ